MRDTLRKLAAMPGALALRQHEFSVLHHLDRADGAQRRATGAIDFEKPWSSRRRPRPDHFSGRAPSTTTPSLKSLLGSYAHALAIVNRDGATELVAQFARTNREAVRRSARSIEQQEGRRRN